MTFEPAELNERVRTRLVGMAADALGSMPIDQVPGPLRRAVGFTPARRARVAGGQILAALGADDEFAARLAIQVRARQSTLVAALDAGERSAETAALALLLRVDNAGAVLAEVEAAEETRLPEAAPAGVADLAAKDAELADLRAALTEAQAALKAEKAAVRHRIGEERARARTDLADSESARETAVQQAGAAAAELDVLRDELRSTTERAAELEAELAKVRRRSRTEREAATIRTRLLLETLVNASQGLRQELALPVVEGSPADLVVADLAEHGVRAPSGATSQRLDDPARLRELLSLPGFHLVVDGYNVTRDSWGHQTLEEQRARLLRGLAPVAARTAIEVTVVFDGANAETRPPVAPPRGLRVLFSPTGVIADDVIRDLVAAEPAGRPVGVVTSDQEIVRAVTRKSGVYAVAARALVRLLG